MRNPNLTPIFLIVLVFSGCHPRRFNSDPRAKVESPNGELSQCHETLNPNAPYTPAILIRELTAALNQAALNKTFETENFRDLLFADDATVAASGNLKPEILEGDSCSLVRAINESLKKPSHFYWLTGNGRTSFGGMALYRGDVFAEGFYRNRSSGVDGSLFARKKYGKEELLERQPWFEWSAQSKQFIPKLESPAPRIFSHLIQNQNSEQLTLYRGTNTKFADKRTALATLNTFMFGTDFGGLFTTPSRSAAKGWASPVLLTTRISPKSLIAPSEKSSPVYVGVEFGYVEIAFLYKAGDTSNLLFDNLIDTCIVREKAQANDLNFAHECD